MNIVKNEFKLNQKEPHIFTLVIMSSFASMGAVIFTPALPEISEFFGISQGRSQLTITLFLVGYALGQLIYGPCANYFGRKKTFLIGVLIATIGSIASIFSEQFHSFNLLILGRLFEALGSSAGLVISFTIINDHYFPNQARKIIAYIMLAFSIIPGIATFTGGILITNFHWISCFYFLLFYGLFIEIPVYRLAETAINFDKKALKIKNIKTNYTLAFKNSILRNTALFYSMTGMCVYSYAATAPFIAMHTLHISAEKFGILGLIPFLGTGLGSIVSAKYSAQLSAKKMIQIGFVLEILSALTLVALFSLHIINLFVLISCGFVFMFGGCLIVSNAASMATSTIDDKANASAVMNFINVGMAVVGTFILSVLPGTPEFRLCVVLILALILMSLLWMKLDFKK